VRRQPATTGRSQLKPITTSPTSHGRPRPAPLPWLPPSCALPRQHPPLPKPSHASHSCRPLQDIDCRPRHPPTAPTTRPLDPTEAVPDSEARASAAVRTPARGAPGDRARPKPSDEGLKVAAVTFTAAARLEWATTRIGHNSVALAGAT
jgi:hypothetical protein